MINDTSSSDTSINSNYGYNYYNNNRYEPKAVHEVKEEKQKPKKEKIHMFDIKDLDLWKRRILYDIRFTRYSTRQTEY